VLARVGPGGHFVAERSTRANVRGGEWFLPQLGVHDSYDAWVAAGRPSQCDEARRWADELLAAREDLPLSDDVERDLGRLLRRAEEADARGRARRSHDQGGGTRWTA